MNNYLITKNTIAVCKKQRKTIIYDEDEIKYLNASFKKVLEFNCSYYGSSLEGRLESAKNILNIKYRVPIIIDANNNLVFLQLESMRKTECLIINVNKIINYEEVNGKLEITCPNNYVFYSNLSKKSFEKLILLCLKLNNTLNSRKMINFGEFWRGNPKWKSEFK